MEHIEVNITSTTAMKTAALPMSFAAFARILYSGDTISTTFSRAEFNNSVIKRINVADAVIAIRVKL